jgi:hypothetical protein
VFKPRLFLMLGILLSAALLVTAPASADTAVLTLDPTEIQTNVQDGAGFWQFDAGDVLFQGQVIGHYRRTKRFGSQAQAGATVTITITVLGPDPPENFTLQGFHTTSSGAESGSVSAASAGLSVAIGASFSSPNGSVITLSL